MKLTTINNMQAPASESRPIFSGGRDSHDRDSAVIKICELLVAGLATAPEQCFRLLGATYYPWGSGQPFSKRSSAVAACFEDWERARAWIVETRGELNPENCRYDLNLTIERFHTAAQLLLGLMQRATEMCSREELPLIRTADVVRELWKPFQEVQRDLSNLVGRPIIDEVMVTGDPRRPVAHAHAHLHQLTNGQGALNQNDPRAAYSSWNGASRDLTALGTGEGIVITQESVDTPILEDAPIIVDTPILEDTPDGASEDAPIGADVPIGLTGVIEHENVVVLDLEDPEE